MDIKKVAIICLFMATPAFCLTYTYKNNYRTGKPDMVTSGVSTSDIPGFSNISATRVLCRKPDGTLGQCKSAVGVNGECTCE